MPKKIQLNIPKPCHEDWDAMTPVDKGKFCGSCEKQVVDFSNMSDRQVAEFFKKPSTGSVCGRFMTDQLDRDLEIPKKRLPWLKYFFSIALPAFFVSLKAVGSKTQGQPIVKKIHTDTTRKNIYDDVKMMGMVSRPQSIRPFVKDTVTKPLIKPVCEKPVMGKPSIESIKGEVSAVLPKEKPPTLNLQQQLTGRLGGVSVVLVDETVKRGIVVNEENEPIPYASIIMSGKTLILAREDGSFEIKGKSAKKDRNLLISAAGYEAREYSLGENLDEKGMNLIRLKANVVLKEVLLQDIVCRIKRSYMMGAAVMGVRVTSNVEDKVPVKEVNAIKVYPNPVSPGAGINIEWKQTEEGYYDLQLIDISGRRAWQKEIWIDAEARVLNIHLPVLPAAGYFLVITHKKTGKRYQEKLVME